MTSFNSKGGTDKLNDLNITKEEVDRIAEALKKPEFRKLLAEYAEEISNPENKKKYEEDIAAMEREQGRDVQFIHPKGAWVIKSHDKKSNTKVFVNIASNEIIAKPSSSRGTKGTSSGLNWNIPHSLAPPHEDVDKGGKRCQVVDVVFHPDTIRMAETNKKFKEMINSIAIEAVCKNFQLDLEKTNFKYPKNITYKGQPRPAVVRKPLGDGVSSSNGEGKSLSSEELPQENELKKQNLVEDKMKSIIKEVKRQEREEKVKKTQNLSSVKVNEKDADEKAPKKKQPKYSVVYSKNADIQDFVIDRAIVDSNLNRPSHIRVTIELPGIEAASELQLDVFERNLHLENNDLLLDLPLSYPVDEANSSAKFDKKRHSLCITMLVLPAPVEIESGPNFLSSVEENFVSESLQKEAEKRPLIEELESSPPTKKEAQEGLSNSEIEEGESSSKEKTKQVKFESESVRCYPDIVKAAETVSCLEMIVCGRLIDFTTISSQLITHEDEGGRTLSFKMEFTSRGQGGFPIFYQLLLRAADQEGFANHAVFPQKDANVGGRIRLVIMKSKPQIWNTCQAGVDLANLKHLNLELDDSIAPLAQEGSNEMRIISVTSCSSPDAPCRLALVVDSDSDDDAFGSFDIGKVESASSPRRVPCSPRQVKFDVGSVGDPDENYNICNNSSISSDTIGLEEFVISFDDDGDYGDDDGEMEKIKVICDNTSDLGKPSILKSSSSIENLGDDSSHNPEIGRRRKSVSFSDKVDNVPFHKADPAAAIYRTLKNRRRRERRRSVGSPRDSYSGATSPATSAQSSSPPQSAGKKRSKRRPVSVGQGLSISSSSSTSTTSLGSSPSSSEELSISIDQVLDPVEISTPKSAPIQPVDDEKDEGEEPEKCNKSERLDDSGSPSSPSENKEQKEPQVPMTSSPKNDDLGPPPIFRPETCLSWETNAANQQPESSSRCVPFELSNSLMYELDASG